MNTTKLFIILAAALLLCTSVIAETTYTSSSKTSCENNVCTKTMYTGTRYAQDSLGEWVDAGEVFSINREGDIIEFVYDGIKGRKTLAFQAGIVYQDTDYPFSIVKQSVPSLEITFPVTNNPTGKKYAVNMTGIPKWLAQDTSAITLTYHNHSGFTYQQMVTDQGRLIAGNLLSFGFDDLLDSGFTYRINLPQRTIYIENLSAGYADGSLYLDPSLELNGTVDAGTGYIYKLSSWNSAHDATSGTLDATDQIFIFTRYNAGIYYIYRGFIPINTTTIPDNASIDSATLSLYVEVKQDADGDAQSYIAVVAPTTQADKSSLAATDYNDCGAVDNPNVVSGEHDITSINTSSYLNIPLTNLTIINNEGLTLLGVREGHDIEDTPVVNGYSGIYFSDLDGANPFYLTVTYSGGGNETDSCSCPGSGQNWEIDYSDNCEINDACDLGSGNITWTGSGNVYFNATITAANMNEPTSNVWARSNMLLNITGG